MSPLLPLPSSKLSGGFERPPSPLLCHGVGGLLFLAANCPAASVPCWRLLVLLLLLLFLLPLRLMSPLPDRETLHHP